MLQIHYDFLSFRRKVKAVNIIEMIFDVSEKYDFEIIDFPQNQFSFRLTLCELIQLRELLDGARYTIELYAMLHEVMGEFEII
ncbi:MAG: hypothetical protein U5M51_16340 [Emticicia sp.]|nr:hypothetical protein [Emticicia sp.]